MKTDVKLVLSIITFSIFLFWINRYELEKLCITTNIYINPKGLLQYNTIKGHRGVNIVRDYNLKVFRSNETPQKILIRSSKLSENDKILYRSNAFTHVKDNEILMREKKLILIYTSLFGKYPWPNIPYDYNFTELDGNSCEVDHCEISYDKNKLHQSDAVFFHGRDMPSLDHLKNLRSRANSEKQIWIWMMQESPEYTFYDPSTYDGIFNWTATYRIDSDIYIPYSHIVPLTKKEKGSVSFKNYAESKDKLLVIIASHCVSFRLDLIKKLSEHIDIDVFGNCAKALNLTQRECVRGSVSCKKLLSRYKFYLASENSFCNDYITEKYFKNVERHVVPVMFSGANYEKIGLPKMTYIDSRNFNNVKELANYLKYLDKNHTAYNEYHKWSTSYKFRSKRSICEVCKALWERENNLPKTVNLGHFWGRNNCQNKNAVIENYIKNN